MPKSKLQLMEESFVALAEHCMAEAWVQVSGSLPDVVVHNIGDGNSNWTVHGRQTTMTHYRLDFMFSDDDICHIEWEPGVGGSTYDFPNSTEERFFIMAGMTLAFQSNVLHQIQ